MTPLRGSRCTTIRSLLGWSRPATVARFVVAVIVNAVDRAAAWPFAHVRQEVQEVGAPAIADRDSTGTVVAVRSVSTVIAPTIHGAPGGVGARLRPTVLVRTGPLTGVRGELGSRFVAVWATETRTTVDELASVAQRVLGARTARFAFQGRTVFRGKNPSAHGHSGLLTALREISVSLAGAAIRTRFLGHGMSLTRTAGLAFRHGPLTSDRRVFFVKELLW